MISAYKKIVLLGTGQLFLNCMAYVKELGIPYVGYDMGEEASKVTRAQAEKKGLNYQRRPFALIYDELSCTKEKTLLLSVINPSIVPKTVINNDQILALNCHQALLPRYKGRNAEAWVIYDGEEKTGITWHKMKCKVDTGEILIQKELPVNDHATSFSLFRDQMKAAYEAFTEFMPLVLLEKETYEPQKNTRSSFHYAGEIPADGILDLSWNAQRISRFLRAMDYGVLPVMPKPVIKIEGNDYTFKSYKISKCEDKEMVSAVIFQGDTLTIKKEGYEIYLKKCVQL